MNCGCYNDMLLSATESNSPGYLWNKNTELVFSAAAVKNVCETQLLKVDMEVTRRKSFESR